jgi:predicted TPR repeat methyltransferase
MTTEDAQGGSPESESTTMTLDQALGLAVERHRSGHAEEAAAIYRQILAVVPDHPDALALLGLAAQQTGQPAAALELMNRALTIVPDHPDALANRGNVHKLMGHLDEAEADYRRALELRPDDPNTLCNLGTVRRARGDYEGAVSLFRTALACRPDHVASWQNLGSTFESMANPAEAADAYREAARLEPDSLETFRKLGSAFYMVGRQADAAQMYRRCLALVPDDARAAHMLAACTGEGVAARASDAYIQAVFDTYAGDFEEKLAELEYRGPALVGQAVESIADQLAPRPVVLDAGCGTGLCGPMLRPFADKLIGVDLSEGMAAMARKRTEYDEVVVAELTDYLRQHQRGHDLIVSADTLIYFGELAEVIAAAAAALRPRGALVCTLERAEPGEAGPQGYHLRPSGRYCHRQEYVAMVLAQAGFTDTVITDVPARKELKHWVPGWLVRGRLRAGV